MKGTSPNIENITVYFKSLIPTTFPKTRRQIFMALIAVLAIALIILYILPDTLALLLNTTLGNAILLLIAIYLSIYQDFKIALAYILGWIVIARFIQMVKSTQSNPKEGFQANTTPWSPTQIREFTQLQHTINPSYVFDTAQIQKVTSPEELQYFMQYQTWPWSKEVEDLYTKNFTHNTYVSNLPEDGLRHAKRLYSQGQILQILAQQSKEGQFLINGVFLEDASLNDLPTREGIGQFINALTNRARPIIRCGINPADPSGSLVPQEIAPKFDGIYGNYPRTHTPITDYATLPQKIQGFQFLGAPCNPCLALNSPPDYSCKFNVDIRQDPNKNAFKNPAAFPSKGLSAIWAYLFNDYTTAPMTTQSPFPTNLTTTPTSAHITGHGIIQ